VVAGFIALILNPFVVFVQRRVRRRGPAVAVVTIWAILVFAGLAIAFGYPLANGLTHLSHRLPEYVRDAAQGHGWIGHLVRRFHLTEWVTRNAPNLEALGAKLARPALTFGKGAVSVLAALATVAALVLLLLLEGPLMRRNLLGLMSPPRAAFGARLRFRLVADVVLASLLVSHVIPFGSAAGSVVNVDTLEKDGVAAATTGEAIALTSLVSTTALTGRAFGISFSRTGGLYAIATASLAPEPALT
jgi:predicted PurR-regulated permease PerM